MSFQSFTPSLIHAGRSVIISPDGSDQIPADLWAQYAVICLLEPDPARSFIDRLERELAERHRRVVGRADAPPAVKIQLPASERGRSEIDVKRIERLKAKLARTDLKLKKRQETEAELQTLLDAPQTAAQAAWEKTAATETADLAKARGEDVERRKSGAMEIRSRDPLMSLLRCGHLTAEQFDVGVAIRTLYERRDAGLGSQMGGIGGVSSPTYDNSAAVFNGLQRAKALQKVGIIERAVAIKCEPNALAMLRVVCRDGLTLSSQGKSALQRNAKCLAAALDVVADMAGGR